MGVSTTAEIIEREHDATTNVKLKKIGNYIWDTANLAWVKITGNTNGVPFVIGGHPSIVTIRANYTGAQTDTAIVTATASQIIIVTKCSVIADNANTVDVSVRIGFGTANTPAADAAQVILFHPGIAAGSGVVEGSGAGIIGMGATNEDLRLTCEDPVTGSISIIITYFEIAIG